jgi:hypothetical protein
MTYIADAPISAELSGFDIFSDVELTDTKTLLARDHFDIFRQEIRPGMLWGWWTQEVAWQLHRFYNEMVAGMRPKLAISAPPQHGKKLGCYRLHCLGCWQAARQENDLRIIQRRPRRPHQQRSAAHHHG